MFDIVTPEDFYKMLVADFDEYMAEPHSARRAMHCAITAYHLSDWVWGGWLKADRTLRSKLGIGNKADFLKWIDNACPWFPGVQGLANGSKHFIQNAGFETSRVQAPSLILDTPGMGLDQGRSMAPSRMMRRVLWRACRVICSSTMGLKRRSTSTCRPPTFWR